MSTEREVVSKLLGILDEIQWYSNDFDPYGDRQHFQLMVQLETLYDIAGEAVPEEYWEEIENIIYR